MSTRSLKKRYSSRSLRQFWIVVDATPHSELGDVLWHIESLAQFERIVLGGAHRAGQSSADREHWALYRDHSPAIADALNRLAVAGASPPTDAQLRQHAVTRVV